MTRSHSLEKRERIPLAPGFNPVMRSGTNPPSLITPGFNPAFWKDTTLHTSYFFLGFNPAFCESDGMNPERTMRGGLKPATIHNFNPFTTTWLKPGVNGVWRCCAGHSAENSWLKPGVDRVWTCYAGAGRGQGNTGSRPRVSERTNSHQPATRS